MEKKIEIIPLLADIVEKNTHSYQSDFSNDEARLTAAMLETYQENRTFLWMSRPCGTWCFLERDVFLQETPAHIVWTSGDYEAEADKIKAYRVIVAHGRKGDFVQGKLQRVARVQMVLYLEEGMSLQAFVFCFLLSPSRLIYRVEKRCSYFHWSF